MYIAGSSFLWKQKGLIQLILDFNIILSSNMDTLKTNMFKKPEIKCMEQIKKR